MENHSYDNVLGMQRGRGDGFTLDAAGRADGSRTRGRRARRPAAGGRTPSLRAFPMPNPCQEDEEPYNTWNAFWASYADGANERVRAESERSGVDGLRRRRTCCRSSTRWPPPSRCATASSARSGAQTYPNRRFLMAGHLARASPTTS